MASLSREKTNNDSFYRSIRFRLALILCLFGALLVFLVYFITLNFVNRMEETLIASRLNADINYIEDLIALSDVEHMGDRHWNVRDDGGIYLGDILVGDGTHERANLDPFLLHEDKTGTFSYVFIKCGDEGLGYVESTPNQKGYQEGHFLRVAGSTKDPNGNSIVGTYMDVLVADVLDAEDTYGGEANVAGGMIYCRYNTLKDKDGNVVGAIVVGRNISELQAQVREVMRMLILVVILAVGSAVIALIFILSHWTNTIGEITEYLSLIAAGIIPEDSLTATSTTGELQTLIDGVNSMTTTLRENEALRVKSETDQLTGLANRFGLNRYAEAAFERCYKNKSVIAVGIMDIDFFKPFNDHYGHVKGDECIVMISKILKEFERREGTYTARYGGDEFIIICEGRKKDQLAVLAEAIKKRIVEENMTHEFSEVADVVTVSQGYCYGIPAPHRKVGDYIHMADGALYEIKLKNKNDFHIVEITEDFRPSIVNDGILNVDDK